tara:strand:+ start:1559 stop:1795 length:237 start_codon:yes stop_codon:yes gene_type:complete
MSEKLDIHDRKKVEKSEILEEQIETGREIDNAYMREVCLRSNPDEFSNGDFTKILYRLPIRQDVLDKIYTDIIADNKK